MFNRGNSFDRMQFNKKTLLISEESPIFFISDMFGKSILLDNRSLEIDFTLPDEYTIMVIRKPKEETTYDWISILSNGDLYINGELDNNYSLNWVDIQNDKIIFNGDTWELNELQIVPYLFDYESVINWSNNKIYYYDEGEYLPKNKPLNVAAEVL